MKGFLAGFLFRPQGKPMIYSHTYGAKLSRSPQQYVWYEAWVLRYLTYSAGSLSILATQSNDFALGYLLIKSLYGDAVL